MGVFRGGGAGFKNCSEKGREEGKKRSKFGTPPPDLISEYDCGLRPPPGLINGSLCLSDCAVNIQ